MPDAVVTLPAATDFVFATAATSFFQAAGANSIVSSFGFMTINGTGGSLTIFDSVGHDVINEGPATEYLGSPNGGSSTIVGTAGGSDTILAGSSVIYDGASAAKSLFIGGTAASDVTAAASETVFSGTGGGAYAPGNTSFLFFGAGGSDTIAGGVTPNSVIWGNTNERLQVSGTAGFGTFVALGNNDSINASAAGGNNSFIVVNEALPAGTFSGSTTLVGTSAGGDTFGIFGEPGAPPPAHAVVIENWQASDTLFLGYSAADVATANAALAAAPAGAGASFTLSDQTTIEFIGNHPTVAAG